jgi:hypothetical protein
VTNLFAAKVSGRVAWDATKLVDMTKVKGFKKQKGGMSEKKQFMVDLIKKGKGKEAVLKLTRKQYPEMTISYRRTLYYHALRQAKKEKRALQVAVEGSKQHRT